MKENHLSVAMLLSETIDVKDLSNVFKKLNIVPHVYEDLETFWTGTLERLPSLCLVDVKKMSQGDLVLRDHPAISSEEMPLVFFYSDKTEPLLASTFSFYHIGSIKKGVNYEGHLKAVLKRANKISSLEQHHMSLKHAYKAKSELVQQLELTLKELTDTDQFQSMVKNVCADFEKMRGDVEFFKAIEKVFNGIDQIEEFSFLELSFNGQKLISPVSQSEKFKSIPSIWLGQTCAQGIELFAQNMATQVALEVLGGDLISINIRGNAQKPDKLIYVKSSNDIFLNNFDWNMLEAYLNGFYISEKNQLEKDLKNEKKFSSAFEAMSFLDHYLFGIPQTELTIVKNQKKDYRLIEVDFSSLVGVITSSSHHRFYWNKFEKEFINKLEIYTKADFRFFEFGVQKISFLVLAKDLDIFFEQLKDHAQKFSYWKYFEDSERFLHKDLKPKIQMVALSSFAYLLEQTKSTLQVSDPIHKNLTQEETWPYFNNSPRLEM